MGFCDGSQDEEKVAELAQELIVSPPTLLDSRQSGAWERAGAILSLAAGLGL